MLQDPRWSKELTLASFALFVASKDPNEKYYWPQRCGCVVGQWLASIGRDYDDDAIWIEDEVALANRLAQGDYISDPDNWTFGKLADRILKHQMA